MNANEAPPIPALAGVWVLLYANSTHTPNAGSGRNIIVPLACLVVFSTHTPRAGRGALVSFVRREKLKFQLTRPAWGRGVVLSVVVVVVIISTHTPRAGRGFNLRRTQILFQISTHTPRVGARRMRGIDSHNNAKFQLTRPAWGRGHRHRGLPALSPHFNSHAPRGGAAAILIFSLFAIPISTHTPRAGRGFFAALALILAKNFNSHAPCGARRPSSRQPGHTKKFQLTRPVRGAAECSTC